MQVQLSSFVLKRCFQPLSMEPCRFGAGCWRPLCPYGHSGRGRAARWAAVWTLLASQEENLEVIKVIPERFAEQNADVPVPPVVAVVEITPEEHISERTQIVDVPVPLDRPGDQACDVPADTVHRQGYCHRACCDTATGPSYSDFVEVCESPAGEVRRGSCGCACDHAHHAHQPGDQACRDPADLRHRQGGRLACCDAETGPSDSVCAEDRESPDQPGDQACRDTHSFNTSTWLSMSLW